MKLINLNNVLFIVAVLLLIQVTAASADQPWNVTITATNQLEPVTFGYHSSATDGFDGFDILTDIPVQGKVVMSLDNIFATSIKVDNLEWVFVVGVPSGSTSTLTWDTSNFYPQNGLVISNESDTINMSAQTSLDLAEGTHNFLIKLVDTTAPVVTIDPVTTPTNISSQTITGTFTETGSGIASITVNGVSATLGATTYSATIPLSEGVNAVTVVAIDNATNSGTNSSSIILDITAPIVMIDTGMTATNATPLMFTGTFTEIGSGIASITVNGVSASISGNTYSASIPLSEGANAVSIIALDNAGNTGTNSTSTSLDATTPIVTIDAVTTPTNVSTQTVTGTFTETGSGIASITVNGVSASITDTTYSATIPLSEGVNAVTVVAMDDAENTGTNSSSITLDTISPVVTIDAVTTPTNVSSQNITGTFSETGSGIASITVNGVSATISGTTYSAIIPLSEDANAVNVIAIDNATNTGTASSSITLDTISPVVTIDTVTTPTNLSSQLITGTFTETGSGIASITVNSVSATISGTTYSATIPLSEGANVVKVIAIDNATNTGTASSSITLDTISPVVTINTVITPTNISSQTVTGTFTETGSGIALITVNGVSASITGTTYSTTIPLSEGANVVNVIAIDNATNTGTASSSIILDIISPDVTIDAVTTLTNVSTQTVTGTIEDVATVAVTCPTATVGTVTYLTGTTWSVEITDITEGDNVITATATDQAGNTASDTATIVLDTTLPIITIDPVTSPTNLENQTVTGTMESGATVEVICPSATVGTVTYPTDTTWSVEITYMTEGDNVITATATDQAGNTASDTATIVVDTTLPTITFDPVTSPTNLENQTVTGTMESGAEVEITCPTATVGTVTYPTGTTWSVEITGMTEGDNVITATATDSFEYTASDTATIVLDITLPSIISVTLNDTVVQTGAPIEVTVSATDENGITSVTADGIPLTLIEGYYVGTITAGTSPVTVNVTDEAGNLVTHTSAYIIDDEPPEVNITEPLQNTTRFVDNIVRGEVIDANFASATLIVKSETNVVVSQYNLSILDNSFSERVEFTPYQNNTLELSAIDEAGNSNSDTIVVFVQNNTMQEEYDVNDSAPVNIDAMNETDTEIEFYSNVNESDVTFTVTAITNETSEDKLNNSASVFGEMAMGKIVEINVTDLDATNESQVQHVLVKLYYTLDDLDLDGDGTVEPGELDEDNMFIYWCNESGNWTKLLKDNPGWVRDNGQEKISGNDPGYVWVDVKHLSMFGLVSLPEPEPTEDDGDEDSSGSSSSGGSGGGGGASGELYENIVCSETDRQYVNQNSDISYSFELDRNIVQYVKFTGLKSAGQVATKVEILKDTSTLVDHAPSDIVYKNLNIWVGNAGWATERNIDDATVVFTVDKSWITKNNIDESSIALYRYSDDTWHKLVTKKIAENANSLQFEAETPGFSPFAVTGKELKGEPGGEGIIPEPTVTAEKTPTPTEKKGIPGFSLFAGVSVLLIAVQLLRKKN